MEFFTLPYDSCKDVIVGLCRCIRYLFANLHEAAKATAYQESLDETTSSNLAHPYWNLQPYKDPMFKSIFSKETRLRLRQIVIYSELCLRDAIRDQIAVASEDPKNLLSKIAREFLDQSRSLIDKAHKWLTWLDSKLSTEFDLSLTKSFTCEALHLPPSLSSLFKMMDHDLHISDICRMRSFAISPLIELSEEFKFTTQTVFDRATLDSETMPFQFAAKLSPPCLSSAKEGIAPTILYQCIRCCSVVTDCPRIHVCHCGGLYRSAWKQNTSSSFNWKSIIDLFCPL